MIFNLLFTFQAIVKIVVLLAIYVTWEYLLFLKTDIQNLADAANDEDEEVQE